MPQGSTRPRSRARRGGGGDHFSKKGEAKRKAMTSGEVIRNTTRQHVVDSPLHKFADIVKAIARAGQSGQDPQSFDGQWGRHRDA